MTSVPWTLFAFGEQHISSALAGVINGATPLMTLVAILVAFPEERPPASGSPGWGWASWGGDRGRPVAGRPGRGVARHRRLCRRDHLLRRLVPVRPPAAGGREQGDPVPPIALATGLMAMGTIQAVPITAVLGFASAPLTWSVVAAMAGLGVVGSGIAYVLNFRVIAASDATTASTVTYLTPLVAVVVGAVVLGEHVTWNQPLGGVLVVLGAAVAQGLVGRRARVGTMDPT
ncbi:MAG: DMT family transporter [Candidatus Nanopelagicales bacterium]